MAHVSVRTVQRRLHDDLKFSHHTARKKPIVTLEQRKNRIAFCKNICSGIRRNVNECYGVMRLYSVLQGTEVGKSNGGREVIH